MEQRKKKIFLWVLAGTGAFIVLLILAGWIAYSAFVSRLFEKPRAFHGPALNMEDFSPLNKAGRKIADAFRAKNGVLPAEAELVFTEKEANALLHFGAQFAVLRTRDGYIRSRFHWKKGRLCVEASYVFKNRPKGKNALNVEFEAVPYVENGKMRLQFLSLKAGSVNTPSAFLGRAASYTASRLENHPSIIKYGKCVKSLAPLSSGGVKLVLDTNELMRHGAKVPFVRQKGNGKK